MSTVPHRPSPCIVETVPQRARRLGVSVPTVRRRVRNGTMAAVRIGGSVRFVADSPSLLPPTCTVRQVANSLNVSELTVRRWIASGALPGQKVGGSWAVLRSDLERLLTASTEHAS